MPRYVDGFLLAMPKKKMTAYKAISSKAGKVWKKYGALEYVECVIDDVIPGFASFAKAAKARPGDVVIFSWIVYKSRAHRDAVNKKVIADPAMEPPPPSLPFDPKRMAMAGFKVLVDL